MGVHVSTRPAGGNHIHSRHLLCLLLLRLLLRLLGLLGLLLALHRSGTGCRVVRHYCLLGGCSAALTHSR